MRLPEMIFFDYGHTLLYEPGWDSLRGNREVLRLATRNPRGITPEEMNAMAQRVFGENLAKVRAADCEVSGVCGDRFLHEYLGLEFDIPTEEVQKRFWHASSPGAIMPGADKIIDYVNSRGIRTAVISNLLWTGSALRERLDRLLPNNRFEFVISSSDYMFRKPSHWIFELALRKAGVSADSAWHCGDNPHADVEGAAAVGIFPVWYTNPTEFEHSGAASGYVPACEHLHITEWDELIAVLEQCGRAAVL